MHTSMYDRGYSHRGLTGSNLPLSPGSQPGVPGPDVLREKSGPEGGGGGRRDGGSYFKRKNPFK